MAMETKKSNTLYDAQMFASATSSVRMKLVMIDLWLGPMRLFV